MKHYTGPQIRTDSLEEPRQWQMDMAFVTECFESLCGRFTQNSSKQIGKA